MTRLEDALKRNELGAAYCDTPDNYRVIVESRPQSRRPSHDLRYIVRVEHGVVPPTDAYDAPDLQTAIALMRTLDLDGFDPMSADWHPADDAIGSPHTGRGTATWSDEMPTRGLHFTTEAGADAMSVS
jgi:hypothetical protein